MLSREHTISAITDTDNLNQKEYKKAYGFTVKDAEKAIDKILSLLI